MTAATQHVFRLYARERTQKRSFGFRRRCGWCGVQLRGWQINLCRKCKQHASDAGIYLQSGGPWCKQASRWDAEPDSWR